MRLIARVVSAPALRLRVAHVLEIRLFVPWAPFIFGFPPPPVNPDDERAGGKAIESPRKKRIGFSMTNPPNPQTNESILSDFKALQRS